MMRQAEARMNWDKRDKCSETRAARPGRQQGVEESG